MEIIDFNIGNIKERDGNPNIMPKDKLEALKRSIQRFGDLQPVIIDQNNILIDGHQRKKAYESLNKSTIPAIRLDLDNETDKILLSQIMNKIKGEHDNDLDALEFKKLLENNDMENITNLIGTSEQEILNIIERSEKEESTAEKVDSIGRLLITCPACHHQFEKGE